MTEAGTAGIATSRRAKTRSRNTGWCSRRRTVACVYWRPRGRPGGTPSRSPTPPAFLVEREHELVIRPLTDQPYRVDRHVHAPGGAH